jgi:hypothetical protein
LSPFWLLTGPLEAAMARMLVFLALVGLGGLFLPWGAVLQLAPSEPALASSATSCMGWMGGLMLGLVLAWLYSIEWSAVSERLGGWLKVQRRRLAWALLGSICAAILIYF